MRMRWTTCSLPSIKFDSSTARRQGGIGLGLTISKNLTELIGGKLQGKLANWGRAASLVFVYHWAKRRQWLKSLSMNNYYGENISSLLRIMPLTKW